MVGRQNLALVVSVAKNYTKAGTWSWLDLIQEGTMRPGARPLKKFDATRG